MTHRDRKREAGHVLPLVALCLTVLTGFAGVGVDVGYFEYRQQAQQLATDAAAIGGAQALVRSGCNDPSVAETAAETDSANDGFTNGSNNVSITVDNPPPSGPYSSDNCAVYVQITTSAVATFFTRLFGYSSGMPETTQAVGAVSSNNNACIYLLSPTVEANFNGANVYAPGCAIAINDTANFNGATITAPAIGYAGGTPNENGSTFELATPAPMLPVADPCGEIPGCAYLTNNPPAQTGCSSFNGNGWSGTLPSGCYSYLNLNGAIVTLNGLYILTGSSNFNGATVTGTNVTLYVASTAQLVNFNGDKSESLSAPTSGNYSGVLYYQVSSNTTNPNFNGTINYYNGLMYAPGATAANFNGSGGGYVVLVFGSWNYNGSTATDFASPPPNGSIVKQAVLGE
jgi:hypothetical protein